jgi:ABC-type amino acid transport substrate-binding protein
MAISPALSRERVLRAVVPAYFPPQYSQTREGEPTGFAVDVMDRVAAMAGYKVVYTVKASWEEVFTAIENKETDIVPNLGVTPERKRLCRFSKPVETFHVSMFVRAGSLWTHGRGSKAHDKVGVVRRNAGMQVVEQFPNAKKMIYDTPEQALFQGLLSGRVDSLIFPEPVIYQIARNAGVSDRIRLAGPPLREIKRGIAVCRDQPEVLRDLNRAVDMFVGSPEYKQLYLRWHGTPNPFWTPGRVATIMGGAGAAAVVIMFLWRYLSIRALNRRLQKSTIRYRTLVRLSPVGIFRTDPGGHSVWVNEKWKAIAGLSQAESLGNGWASAIHPEDRQKVFRVWNKARRKIHLRRSTGSAVRTDRLPGSRAGPFPKKTDRAGFWAISEQSRISPGERGLKKPCRGFWMPCH